MENKSDDALFRELAGRYAEAYGAELRREAAELTRDGVSFDALAFTLPENLSVASVETDNGQSVYRLTDARRDDVVMTLEAAYDFSDDGLQSIPVGGSVAYARSGGDYNLLTFESDGIRYILTCRYELGTLTALGALGAEIL